MDTRSPLDGIFNIIGALPQGHDKPVKHALYNAVALFLLFISCAAGWALYVILEPFIKPLIWALLVGSVLHPLKHSLRDSLEEWFKTLDESSTPMVIGLILLPINVIHTLSEFIGCNLAERRKVIIGSSVLIGALHLGYYYTPGFAISLILQCGKYVHWSINSCLNKATTSIVATLILGYMLLMLFTWSPENNSKFHYGSTAIWFMIFFCGASYFGTFQTPVFILLLTVFVGGFFWEVYNGSEEYPDGSESSKDSLIEDNLEENRLNKKCKTLRKNCDTTHSCGGVIREKSMDATMEEITGMDSTPTGDMNTRSFLITQQGTQAQIHEIRQKSAATSLSHIYNKSVKRSEHKLQRSLSQPHFFKQNKHKSHMNFMSFRRLSFKNSNSDFMGREKIQSTFYLYSVFWACIIMLFWKNLSLLPLLPLLILFYVVKHVGFYLGLWQGVATQYTYILGFMQVWCADRCDALVPMPVRGLYKVVKRIHNIIKLKVLESIDTISSCVVILGLIIFLLCASVFIIIQIYAEAIMLVQMTSNVINQTVVHNPELRQLLPPTWDDTVDSILDNAYQYGREGISKVVRGMMSDVDTVKSEKLEKQVLELWDRIYQSWLTSDETNGPKVTQDAVRHSWEDFLADIQKSPEMLNLNGLLDFAKQNVGTLVSLLESVWSIVKGNISLMLGSVGAFLSIILGGGTAVLNFILNVIVFLTTLFYLLNSSGELYKPVEIMTNFSPSGSRFGHALEGAVNGVFVASLKMVCFYGLWTWFIHNLFAVKIVYLPTAFAAILGAIPFLGTYWACVPAVLDLWLAQDRGLAAILFAGFQFLPTYIVDSTIYKEIKGGHPYLTGLAIAGGIFCLGVEGAIIGPILLCGLYVAIDLSSTLFKESPSEESLVRIH